MKLLFRVILKFCTTNHLFKYFRKRYSDQQLEILNKLVRTRGKIRNLRYHVAFLKACIKKRVVPKFLKTRIEKSRARINSRIESAFLHDEIENSVKEMSTVTQRCAKLKQQAVQFLSYFDLIRFCRYMAKIDARKEDEKVRQNERNISLLLKTRYGTKAVAGSKVITNLSDYELSDTEELVLSLGLDFSVPPTEIKREEVFAEFEVLLGQLSHHHQKFDDESRAKEHSEKIVALKAKLSSLAHGFCGTPIDRSDFTMTSDCYRSIRSLKSNKSIHITKPDKGSGVVILNKCDYISKMDLILGDKSKFEILGPACDNDNTSKIEARIQRLLLTLKKAGKISSAEYDDIRPTGSIRPRMYGLPKTHKSNVPLRPILSMVGSAYHKVAKWIARYLEPVSLLYGGNCIRDSFTFADTIRNVDLDESEISMCSFDISSLFTNVPVQETIEICANELYGGVLPSPPFSRSSFVKLMRLITCDVEFSFNNTIYTQIDGVAMGSPLGPILANIFVGYYEKRLFEDIDRPLMYQRYVDDTFAIFENESQCDLFLSKLNGLHPSLKFTMEKEVNNSLAFLDVVVEKTGANFVTSVYRKPTFSGQYISWDSFCPVKRKVNLIRTLVHRALMICSKVKLDSELENIRSIFQSNGYPDHIIKMTIDRKLKDFRKVKPFGPRKCPVYLHLPWIGKVSNRFEKQIKSSVSHCFSQVEPQIIFMTKSLMPATQKDVLPATNQSNIIYEYTCRCDSRYVGRTSQRLQQRIRQHVPRQIRINNVSPTPSSQSVDTLRDYDQVTACNSAIGQHLLSHPECADHYNDSQFSILARGRSLFHLKVLESTIIKLRKPILCRQKERLYTLGIFH